MTNGTPDTGHGLAMPGRLIDDVCRCHRCLALDGGPPPMQQQTDPVDRAAALAIEGITPDLNLIRADQRADASASRTPREIALRQAGQPKVRR